MNKVIYKYDKNITLTFTDQVDSGEGKIIEGSFYNETSLLEDELSIDTMTVIRLWSCLDSQNRGCHNASGSDACQNGGRCFLQAPPDLRVEFHLNSPFISLHLKDLKYQQRPNWQFERSRASLGSLLSDLNSEPSSWRTRL